MSKFRKIEAKIWNDANFAALSDQAKLLFFFLLTHPHVTALGAMRANTAGMAAELKWSKEGFDKAFQEGLSKGMIKHDSNANFVWLPNFLKYNKPESPNVVKSWDKWLEYLPECELKNQLIQQAEAFVKGLGEGFQEALPKAFRAPSPNHEHEHEHKHEQKNSSPVAIATEAGSLESPDDVTSVFDYWKEKMSHPKAKLDNRRQSKIKAALKLGFSVDNLKLAIDGCANSAFHMGQNENKRRHDGIDLIFRSAEKIEEFIGLSQIHSPSTAHESNQAFEGLL